MILITRDSLYLWTELGDCNLRGKENIRCDNWDYKSWQLVHNCIKLIFNSISLQNTFVTFFIIAKTSLAVSLINVSIIIINTLPITYINKKFGFCHLSMVSIVFININIRTFHDITIRIQSNIWIIEKRNCLQHCFIILHFLFPLNSYDNRDIFE